MPRAGDKIGPYILNRELGRGQFGIVWLAERKGRYATTEVALKLIIEADPDVNSITQEAQLWAKVSEHINVLPIIEADDYDGQVVIVSQYVPGGSLEGWLKKHGGKAPSIEAAVSMMSGILSGLEYLHSKKIIHRDLKPANILLQGETPRLADFGLARVLKSSAHSGGFAGTPLYMPPEAFSGARSERTDVWSAGVILYQMLCGNLPYPQRDVMLLIGALSQRDPEPLPSSIPAPLREVTEKALQRDETKRYQSVSEMRTTLFAAFNKVTNPLPEPSRLPTDPFQQVSETIPYSATQPVEPPVILQTNPIAQAPNVKLPNEFRTIPDTEEMPLRSQLPIASGPQKNSRIYISIAAALVIVASISTAIYSIRGGQSAMPGDNPSLITNINQPADKIFQFDTVTVDANGNIKDRIKKQAPYFTEDLGNSVVLEMVAIPDGTFTMGTAESDVAQFVKEYTRHGFSKSDATKYVRWETPQHQVTVPSFYMGRYEVTQAQWKAIMETDPSKFKGDNLPVEQVSWNETVEFCKKLSQKTGKQYRLPTEAEWEYACRAGTTAPFAFGPTITPDIVNYDGDYPYGAAAKGKYREKTTPIGSLGIANGFGLYDMHGNVWEWCMDVFHDNYNSTPTDGRAWMTRGDQNLRVLRGGSWYSNGNNCRSATRSWTAPGSRYTYIGFRVVSSGARTQQRRQHVDSMPAAAH